jgi:hypothetical protein
VVVVQDFDGVVPRILGSRKGKVRAVTIRAVDYGYNRIGGLIKISDSNLLQKP